MNLKSQVRFVPLLYLLSTFTTRAQGTFIYDQQSADESQPGEVAVTIQANQPMGQSFIPTLSSVGFVRLQLYSGLSNNGLGALVSVNLRANSILGTVLGTTSTVVMPDGFFGGYVDFLFSAPVSVTPGVTYYFQPVVQNGDYSAGAGPPYNYSRGTIFAQGVANPASDLWFREGILVPEPGSAALILLSGIFWRRLWRKKQQNPCDVVS
jgi:hypothetical protein